MKLITNDSAIFWNKIRISTQFYIKYVKIILLSQVIQKLKQF